MVTTAHLTANGLCLDCVRPNLKEVEARRPCRIRHQGSAGLRVQEL